MILTLTIERPSSLDWRSCILYLDQMTDKRELYAALLGTSERIPANADIGQCAAMLAHAWLALAPHCGKQVNPCISLTHEPSGTIATLLDSGHAHYHAQLIPQAKGYLITLGHHRDQSRACPALSESMLFDIKGGREYLYAVRALLTKPCR